MPLSVREAWTWIGTGSTERFRIFQAVRWAGLSTRLVELRCCTSLTTEGSRREPMPSDALHEQAISRPRSHDEPVQPQRVAAQAGSLLIHRPAGHCAGMSREVGSTRT